MDEKIEFARIYGNFIVGVESSAGATGSTKLSVVTTRTGVGTGNQIEVCYDLVVPHELCSDFEFAQILRWVSNTLKKKIVERHEAFRESLANDSEEAGRNSNLDE